MQWADCFSEWRGAKSATSIALCLAIIVFPFSVAVTNVFLGLVLVIGLLSGLLWQGIKQLWGSHRVLLGALGAYLALVSLGLLWSQDQQWGRHVLARHWFWLLLPVVVMVLSSKSERNTFLVAMSAGLTVNLMFCVLQATGMVASPVAAGSGMDNPTGFIGHTSFGFIYGIWSAWLLHLGMVHPGKWAWLVRLLALWAVVMVFMAQGQSGYIIMASLFFLVALKWSSSGQVKNILVAAVLFLLIAGAAVMAGPGKERILGTWQGLTQSEQQDGNAAQTGARSSTQARLAWWSMSIDIWRQGTFFGVGTGGFPKAVKAWQENPGLQHGYMNAYSQFEIVHPHNQYLITLVRYGVIGLLSLLVLMAVWIRSGVNRQWRNSSVSPLIALTGVALLLHGIDSISLEEHYSTIFAIILLGAGLSETVSENV